VSARWRIPMADLPAQYATLRAEITEAVEPVLASQGFIGGPEVTALEEAMARLCGTDFAVSCASGSDALLLSLQAAGVGPGDAVLCPALTFFATAGAVARFGARPVFVDVDPATLTVGPEQAEAGRTAAGGRVRAIVPVDLFGRVAPLGPLLAWAAPLGVAVVEDAAQAIAARDADGLPTGSRGLAGAFSFFPSKNLGGFGDGGCVTTGSAALAERVRSLANHGVGADGRHQTVGTNSRLDALQAAVLRVKLRHLDAWTKRRREHAEAYDARFAAAGARPGTLAGDAPLATPPPEPSPGVHVYNQYVVRVPADRRDALAAHLAQAGIETRVYYPRALHQEPCFAGAAAAPLPAAEAACREGLALPVHPELAPGALDEVADRVVGLLGL